MKKLISLALSFCILIMQSGCTATTHLTMDEASHAKSEKNFLVLHTPNKLYRLYDYKFTENTLEGTLKQYASKTKNDLHVYTSLNFELNSDPESSQFITVKKTDINNITRETPEISKTTWIIGASVLAVLVVLIITGAVTSSPDAVIGGM